jgi:hypothetical protein
MRVLTLLSRFILVAAFMCSDVIGQTSQFNAANNQILAPDGTAQATGPTKPADTTKPADAATPADTTKSADATKPKPSVTADTVAQQVKDVKAIRDALNADSDLDFGLVIGIGSLIVVSGMTDYSDQSNVIHSNNIGKATPQFLAGVAFRSHLQNVLHRYRGCTWDPNPQEKEKTDASRSKEPPDCYGIEPWQKRPWSGFVSVKFSPSASQSVNGFVFGATYAVTKYLNALIGFSLTPINEPAPGFRIAAAQLVKREQQQGLLQNFDPNAMLNNAPNAFDGFPVTDPTGKLIYAGNPLTVHYHGGLVLGVSIPIYFSSVFK